MRKKRAIVLFLVSFLLVATIHQFSEISLTAQEVLPQGIPAEIRPCLPKNNQKELKADEAFIRGYFREKKQEYYIIQMSYPTTAPFEDYEGTYESWGRFFVKLDEVGCLPLNTTEAASGLIFEPLTKIVSEPIAKAIALQWWQHQLDLLGGNREKLKQELLIGLEPGPERTVLFKEDIWALKQLGISFPAEILNQPR